MREVLYPFSGSIKTSREGIERIGQFYQFCLQYQNSIIKIEFKNISFFDANLAALLLALTTKLEEERNIRFNTDEYPFLNSQLGVLKRNGFLNYLLKLNNNISDERKSVIPFRSFDIMDADKFVNYIQEDLLKHRGLKNVCIAQLEKLKNSYFEIFDNVGIHAETRYPVFTCGQFYPQQKELIFTITDLGNGFLKKIRDFTANDPYPVKDIQSAIKWAILGGSTKVDAQGGTGLRKILKYCLNNNGAMHIYSDSCYWCFDGKLSINIIGSGFCGTTISLIFRNL